MALLALLGTQRTLSHGRSAAAVLVYSLLSQALCGMGDYGNGQRLTCVAERLGLTAGPADHAHARSWAGLHRASFVRHWSAPPVDCLQELEQAYAANRRTDPLLAVGLPARRFWPASARRSPASLSSSWA